MSSIRSGGSTPRRPRRGDIHSSFPLSSPSLARRAAQPPPSDPLRGSSPAAQTDISETPVNRAPTLSAIDGEPALQAGEADGGMVKFIWGTTISLQESMNDFRNFLRGFKPKYRAIYNTNLAQTRIESGGIAPASMPLYDGLPVHKAEDVLYERYLKQLRETGQTNLNLDAVNLLAYPPTKRLYHQLVNYPQEVIPIMDQVLRDVMIETAEEELEVAQNRFAEGAMAELNLRVLEEEVREVEGRVFKVRPYGGERTVNMRDLNPGGESGTVPRSLRISMMNGNQIRTNWSASRAW